MSSPGAGPSRSENAVSRTASWSSSSTAPTERLSFFPLLDDEDEPGSLPLSEEDMPIVPVRLPSKKGKERGVASRPRTPEEGDRLPTASLFDLSEPVKQAAHADTAPALPFPWQSDGFGAQLDDDLALSDQDDMPFSDHGEAVAVRAPSAAPADMGGPLQPYTREKQAYERALRRGGLVAGKKAVAAPTEVRGDEDEDGDEGGGGAEGDEETQEHTPFDAIVIGATPAEPAPAVERRRKPVQLVDDDYDTFFFNTGRAVRDDDDDDMRALRRIAGDRVRADKEERRRIRKAERADRAFEQFVREKEGAPSSGDDAQRPAAPAWRERPIATVPARTPGRSTYSKKQRRREGNPKPRADSSAGQTPTARRAAASVQHASSISRRPTRRDPDSSPSVEDRHNDGLPPYDVHDAPGFDAPGFDALDTYNFGADDDSIFLDSRRPSLFDSDKTPTRPSRRARSRSASSQSSSSNSSEAEDSSQAIEDKRARIARRMLPAAMLKRLEREAADKQRQKLTDAERRRQGMRVESPVRPGRAVVRRGGGGGADLDIGLFSDGGDESDVSADLATTSMRASSVRPPSARLDSSADQPIVVSDESSEAEEDNRGLESLVRLNRGDFEGIVAGRPRQPARPPAARRRVHRPALGLVKRVRAPAPPSPKHLVQTRLDFAPERRRPAGKADRASAKRKRMAGLRPAIRLDDHVIFAHDEFAFESESEAGPGVDGNSDDSVEVVAARRKRVFGRTTSRADAAPGVATAKRGKAREAAKALDDGVGKARSWANFERFPIDFDISPLPSGVYCALSTVPGSGRLQALLDVLEGRRAPPVPVEAYGIVLQPEMGREELAAVLPIVFERLRGAVVAYANDRSGKPDLAPLDFLGDHAIAQDLGLGDHLRQLSDSLGQIIVSGSKQDHAVANELLLVRWAMLEVAFKTAGDVTGLTKALLAALLRHGFHRTMRPIKSVLRGDADTPEIDDVSVSLWAAVSHALAAYDQARKAGDDTFPGCLDAALDEVYATDQVGPLAAERIWYLAFGLCALSQIGADGVVGAFVPRPRWALVKRAIGLIKVGHSVEAEENAQLDQLKGRDRYIKVMVARCVRLSASWRWHFDRASFSVATRDLGVIFKDRQHRNLPTEPAVDFPRFITQFDIALTAAEDSRRESAFDLYLRLACVAASDLIGAAQTMAEAQRAERDVQRLIMSIFPLSAVAFTRALPPTPRQLGALVNRYSTMVVAAYFSPALLPWLLANSAKWLAFEHADTDSRQVAVRGYMYLAVACRHHAQLVEPVVRRLADVLATLAAELDAVGRPGNPPAFPTRQEIERTMVLVVACFRQIITHHSYDTARQREPVYPDPTLLHESWTARVFELDLAKDTKSGLEIVATIQAFLDARARALPTRARRARENRAAESLTDDYPSLGFEFDDVDLAALGDGGADEDPMEKQDAAFAKIIMDLISPKIYRLLSDMLPAVDDEARTAEQAAEREAFIGKLTTCWSDCAGVVVVEHRLMDWSSFIGSFGTQSWLRLPNEAGRAHVGLRFMLAVARADPSAFRAHDDDFVALLFQALAADRVSVEHEYASALFALPGALDHALLEGLARAVPRVRTALDRAAFLACRPAVLEAALANVPSLLASHLTPPPLKTLVYRAANALGSALLAHLTAHDVHATGEVHRIAYRAFARDTVRAIDRLAGEWITENAVPSLGAVRAIVGA
ncbi:hypothetical protein Q5752_004701 [Cryptotrichosporon argae]